jgi:hypothetical protein
MLLKNREKPVHGYFVTVVVAAPIRLTATKVVTCAFEGPERLVWSMVGLAGPLAPCWSPFCHRRRSHEQVGDADQDVGHHMQPKHSPNL